MKGWIEVLKPGILSTVQDGGRRGYQASGFSVSGCMDEEAYQKGNALLNNALDAAAVEMSVLGGTFRFLADTYFVLTGADMQPALNGKAISRYRLYAASHGDVLECRMAVSGRFSYLCVAGGIRVEPVMGSRSTNLKCGIGGFEGRALKSGDHLPVLDSVKELWNAYLKEMPEETYGKEITVHVVPGPQQDYFTEKGLETFCTENYHVTDQSDRMGYRLEGPAVEYKDKVDILSDGIVFGSIQIPPKGTPMIMMADRQTTGGYAKIGTVVRADLPRLSQCMPGSMVRFQMVSVKEAQGMYKKHRKEMKHFCHKSGYRLEKRD